MSFGIAQFDFVDDTVFSSDPVDLTLTGTVAAGELLVIGLFSVNFGTTAVTVTDDVGGNAYVSRGAVSDPALNQFVGFRTCLVTNGGAGFTLTFDKGSNSGRFGAAVWRVTEPHADIVDGAAVFTFARGNLAAVDMPLNVYTDDIAFAIMATRESSVTGITSIGAGFTQDHEGDSTPGQGYHVAAGHLVVSDRVVRTPSWVLANGAFNVYWCIGALYIKGFTTKPTVESVSTTSPLDGGLLTVSGLFFGASPGAGGALRVGGVTGSIQSWSATDIQIAVRLGLNQYGVPLDVVVSTATLGDSNAFGIAKVLPKSGWDYLNVTTPWPDPTGRITAVADAVAGDQVNWDTHSGLVTLYDDLTGLVDPTVASFQVRLWTAGGGWGKVGVQSFDAEIPFSAQLPTLPAGIPYPVKCEATTGDRLASSQVAIGKDVAAFVARSHSNDFIIPELNVEWVLTQAQLADFIAWGKADINRWHSWFSMALPGRTTDVPYRPVCFVAPPERVFLGAAKGGLFRVTARLVQRGRSVV